MTIRRTPKVAIVDTKSNTMSVRKVEITQHGRYSTDLTDVIAKKLRKRYAEGTVLLVLVEEAQGVHVLDLYDFVQKHNPHGQEIVIIGGAEDVGKFKVLPWNEVAVAAPDVLVRMEITVDTRDRGKARCRYDGVVFEPPPMSRFRPQFPVFVRSVALHR